MSMVETGEPVGCVEQIILTAVEVAQIDALDGHNFVHEGPFWCDYGPFNPGHTEHVVYLQSNTALDNDPGGVAAFWIFWSDAGRRELAQSACCPVQLEVPDDEDTVSCVFPKGHKGQCSPEAQNECFPNARIASQLQEIAAGIRSGD